MQAIHRKSIVTRAAGAACLVVLAGTVLCRGQEQAQVNRSLKILYVGHPGSDREKDFVGFLKKYFDVVQTGNLQAFKETDTQGFDVTLFDWESSRFDADDFPLTLSRSFSRPVMTFGIPGGWMCERWRLKTRHN